MASTTIPDSLRVKQWDADQHKEYVRSNRFKRYMKASTNSIIMVKEALTKKDGDAITIPLVGALPTTGGYNTGSTTLVGNEKAQPTDGFRVSVGVVRDATLVNVEEEQASPIDIRNAGKTALKDLQMRYLRNDIIGAFGSVQGEPYASASAARKNSWHSANADRVQYGASNGNYDVAGHAESLSNVDGAADTLTGEIVERMKRKAQTAVTANGDGIRPFKYGEDYESYVMFVNSFAFRDFRKWLETSGNLRDAMERGKSNPLFSGPESYEWDGVMVRKIPEIGNIEGVGAAGIDVAPCYLCGTQALAAAWAKRTKTIIRKEDDYGFQHGVGFMEMRGVEKVLYGQSNIDTAVDWGMVTGFVAALPDS